MLHVKITLSYAYMFELADEDSKGFCATFLNASDAVTMGIVGIVMTFCTRDIIFLVELVNYIETAGILIFIAIIPESPKWLLLNGFKERGIQELNYIALINGSKMRIPMHAEFDLIG